MVGAQAQDLLAELLAHAHARLVHRNVVDHRVGSREVDELEDAGREAARFGDHLGVQLAVGRHHDRLARLHVAHQLEAQQVERDRLGGHRVLLTLRRLAFAEHQRADAVRVAEGNQAKAQHQRDDGVAALAATVHGPNGRERRSRRQGAALGQLVGHHVHQHFGIGFGVHMPAVLLEHLSAQGLGVDQVAVVGQRDAPGRTGVEGLRFVRAGRTSRRVAAVADAHAAGEFLNAARGEHVADEPGALVQTEARTVDRGDAGGVLPAVLKDGEPVVQPGRDVTAADDADDSAHSR